MESGSPTPNGANSLGASQKQRRRRRKKMQDRESAPAQLPTALEPEPAPAPDAAEREACKIKLSNVDYSCTEEEIRAAAAKVGTVVRLPPCTLACVFQHAA